MPFEAPFRAAPVRYVAVGTGFSPRTGAKNPTDVAGPHGDGGTDRSMTQTVRHVRRQRRWSSVTDLSYARGIA